MASARNDGERNSGGRSKRRRFPVHSPRVSSLPPHTPPTHSQTPTQYFVGNNNTEAIGNVNYILTNTIRELARDPSRTYTFVEQGFFQMWWKRQDDGQPEQGQQRHQQRAS